MRPVRKISRRQAASGLGRPDSAGRAEAALREDAARFRALVELSANWYWEVDAEMRYTALKGAGHFETEARVLGKRREELPGFDFSAPAWREYYEAVAARRPFRDLVYERTLSSGEKRWVCLSGEPLHDAAGRFTGYHGVGRDCTDLKSAEQARRQSEARFRSLTELSTDWYWEQDEHFRFTMFSEGTLGANVARNALGKTHREITYLGPTQREWEAHEVRLAARIAFRDLELGRPGKDGAPSWISVSGEPVFDERGAFKGYRGTGRDITTRKREEQLLHLEHAVTRCLAGAESAEAGIEAVMRAMCESHGWVAGRYWRADEEAGVLRFGGMWAASEEERARRESAVGLVIGRGTGLLAEVWATGRPVWIADARIDPRVVRKDLVLERSLFIVALTAGGRNIGVLSFADHSIREPDQRLLQAAGVIGSQVGQFLERKRAEEEQRASRRLRELEHAVTRTLTEAESAAQALREVIGVICRSQEWDYGRYFHLDEAAGLMRFREGWTADEANIQEFVAASRALAFAPGIGSVAFPVAFEGRVVGVLDMPGFAARAPDAGLLQTMRVIGSQIGQFLARKQKEDSLHRFRAALDASGDLVFLIDPADARLIDFNEAACKYLGYERGELLHRPTTHILAGVPMAELLASYQSVMLRPDRADSVMRTYRRKDGGTFQAEAVRRVIDSPSGPILVVNSRDLTERHKQEAELRRFRLAMDMSLDAVYLTDPASLRFVDVNQAACQRMGRTREELLQMGPQDVLDITVEQLREEQEAVIAAGDRGTRTERFGMTREGERHWTELNRRALQSESGTLIVTVARDITGRKLAEERRAAHARFQGKIARFGEAALGRREAAELVDDALQTVLEALPGTAVTYLERPGEARELIVRGAAGFACGEPSEAVRYAAQDAVALPLERGMPAVVERDEGTALLPCGWAGAFQCAALVPVHGDNRARGALCVLSEERGAFGDEESKFLGAMASVLSAGLRRIDSEGRLAFLAQFDALTSLPNRALLADRFSQMIVQARRRDKPLGVLFIDLDDFKLVNDSLGHAGGDELLKEVARRLQKAVRAGDTVARISGDEFAVILGDLARPDDAALVAQKIIDRLSAPVEVSGHEVFVTASVGIAAFPADGGDAETLLGAADAAMYRAKQSGRNAYQFFTADINQRTRARAQLGSELRRALEREEFVLFYQPKFDLKSGQPCAAEALLRWRHPERGLVLPGEFIPVLEESGLIVRVGEWVLRRACEDLKAWQAAGLRALPVAVNLSARQFRQSDLDVRIRALVRAAGVDPRLIELEITESHVMQDPEHANRVMRALSKEGFRVAIDDFGTGYSSLSYLTRFPVSALKIDRSFVADLLKEKAAATIVRTIIDMAHTLGFSVVAEGVETEPQAAFLRELGCEQAQGFHFARPMPQAELLALLAAASARAVTPV